MGAHSSQKDIWLGQKDPGAPLCGSASVHLPRSEEAASVCPLPHRAGITDGPTVSSAAAFSKLAAQTEKPVSCFQKSVSNVRNLSFHL